jgi:hypothetical protein
MAPKPSDLVRPAPDEPVRIQPPPGFVHAPHDSSAEEHAAPPRVNEPVLEAEPAREAEVAREAETAREHHRPDVDPERRRVADRSGFDANRWVRQRLNLPRGGGWQSRGHTSMRGR